MTDETPVDSDDGEESIVAEGFFDATVRDGVLELARPGTTWLSTGWRGGRRTADAAYSLTVPEGWSCDAIAPFVASRLADAGFDAAGHAYAGFDPEHSAASTTDAGSDAPDAGSDAPVAGSNAPVAGSDAPDAGSDAPDAGSNATDGDSDALAPAGSGAVDGGLPPVLLTGVSMAHARGARLGPVEAYATVGLTNPAALPTAERALGEPGDASGLPDGELEPGTANVVVGTTRDLDAGALANLVAIAAEARATTLIDAVGVPGTTSDAVVVASDPTGECARFSGSATRVGAAARACVRDALTAALHSRYDDPPDHAMADARYGVTTDARATVFDPDEA